MDVQVPLQTFKDICALHCNFTQESLDRYLFNSDFNEACAYIQGFRLDQLKRVVKDLKSAGYYTLQLTGNKSYFVDLLCRLLRDYRNMTAGSSVSQAASRSAGTAQSSSVASSYAPRPHDTYTNRQAAIPNPYQQPVSSSYNTYNNTAVNGYSQPQTQKYGAPRPAPTYPPLPNATTVQRPSIQQSQPRPPPPPPMPRDPLNSNLGSNNRIPYQNPTTSSNILETTNPSMFNPFAVCSNAVEAGQPVPPTIVTNKSIKLNDRNRILNTREKYEIFYQLSVISGITKEDILREIDVCPESELNADYVLYRIISRKDPEKVRISR